MHTHTHTGVVYIPFILVVHFRDVAFLSFFTLDGLVASNNDRQPKNKKKKFFLKKPNSSLYIKVIKKKR